MISDTFTILLKDLKLDLRSMENFISMLFFSVIIIMIFSFAMPVEGENHKALAPGIFWVTFILSGILSLNKSFQIEKDNQCMDALLLQPISRGSIFFGKMLENVIFILLMQCILIPLFSLFFYQELLNYFLPLLGLTCFAAVGFASLGTLLGGLTADIRFKEILLPILLFPLLVPLLLASVTIMGSMLGGEGLFGEMGWIKLLLGFDLIFMILAYLVFDFVMEM